MIERIAALATRFDPADWVALGLLLVALLGSTWAIEHPPAGRPSTHMLMRRYRIEWMLEMAARDTRIFDSQVLAILRQGSSFFASTSLIAIGGAAAALGQAERVAALATDIAPGLSAPLILWEIKILLLIALLLLAFLKFVWAIRLFGYCAVLMAAMPNDGSGPEALALARRAGRLNILAERSFTRGMRAIYFALAALAWFLGPEALVLATLATLGMLWRREFASQTRSILLEDTRPAP